MPFPSLLSTLVWKKVIVAIEGRILAALSAPQMQARRWCSHSRSQMIADLYPKVGAFETIVEGWRSWSHCRRHLFRRGGLTVQDSLSRTSRRLRSCSSFGDHAVCSLIAQLANLQQVKDLSKRDPNIIQMWDPLKKARHVRASAVFVMWKELSWFTTAISCCRSTLTTHGS